MKCNFQNEFFMGKKFIFCSMRKNNNVEDEQTILMLNYFTQYNNNIIVIEYESPDHIINK